MSEKYTQQEMTGLMVEMGLLRFNKISDRAGLQIAYAGASDEDLFLSWWEADRDRCAVVFRAEQKIELFDEGVTRGVRDTWSDNFWEFVELMVSAKKNGPN